MREGVDAEHPWHLSDPTGIKILDTVYETD